MLMPQQINIRFYEELNDFLPPDKRKKDFNVELKKPRSVKDLIESVGVPHTEIDLIIVNGESVDFNYQVKPDDRISVYPVFESIDISPLRHCQPRPLRNTRFVLDVHLGRLAAYLRMLGFDTLYENDYDDPVLADISADEHRILLTCDRLLLMRKQITHGYFVRSRLPKQQLLEILSRFDLYDNVKPFTRCIHCNGSTRAIDKKLIEDQLLPKTKKYYDEFYQCDSCRKIYWKGSHFQKMQDMINKVKADVYGTLADGD
jgi:uncharacterized protein with PIN domain/sulfur carrier protein ThiS